ncbi:hypothetical protein N8J89_16205 [Crossiella sp. CA-258035]|uniref:hypothetical protein n=1 Tax=Crossiella sp. CA-258035 TaxID=2981138 RepID=UPI0024BC62B0|nr:hypothetical protein [Crossiella sp. CA-258035]WHT22542.1 hypothetical protein N8J89_16205 [Crossiella sp. CA-258035]
MSPNDFVCAAEDEAQAVVRSAASAWHGSRGSERLDIPLSVMSAVNLIRPLGCAPGEFGNRTTRLSTYSAIGWLAEVWARFLRLRPDLVPAAYPVAAWLLGQERRAAEADLGGAHAILCRVVPKVVQWTAISGGVGELDLLGELWQAPAVGQPLEARAQFCTPRDVAAVGSALLGEVPKFGSTVRGTCVGTGGLFLSLTWRMRAGEADVASVTRIGSGVDELVITPAVVNAHRWGLGGNVILSAVDVLPGCPDHHGIVHREHAITVARTVQATATARNLLTAGATP